MKRFFVLILFILFAFHAYAATVQSPDGTIKAGFTIDEEKEHRLFFRVEYKNHPVIVPSPVGFVLKETPPLGKHLSMQISSPSTVDRTWEPVYGEQATIRNHYVEQILHLKEKEKPFRHVDLIVRVYNEGVAFCYRFPAQDAMQNLVIEKENTAFRFHKDYTAWATYSAQGEYKQVPISKIRQGCERPLTIKMDEDLYIALAEARLVDYARTKFDPLGKGQPGLVTSLASDVEADLPYRTPWRVVMIGESPGRLLENNELILNLNEPCAIKDTSWIKPGKVIREVSLTTAGGKACVDFAEKYNLQYVEYDAGWYGHEYSDESDATTISVDPKRSPGPLDLHEVIRYAEEKGIGIIVYVNRRALEKQLDEILPLYQNWGIRGVKYGFVRVGSQKWTTWLHEAVRKAADHRLMVDIHDEYRPTGYSRTYPNLMTQEGIRGDEARPTNDLTLTILFTRMLAGAGDNTICYYDDRVFKHADHAYQLAKAVCFYSPWQFIFWYDRPAEILKEPIPEIEFFKHVPAAWDETKVLHGAIGEYAVIARRSGNEWFIGCMNAATPRTFDIPLSFLGNKTYQADRYFVDQDVQT
ncbi:alpha-glucosidase, partial [bacterium]|nr:alpha-glucosidase [bacterium]